MLQALYVAITHNQKNVIEFFCKVFFDEWKMSQGDVEKKLNNSPDKALKINPESLGTKVFEKYYLKSNANTQENLPNFQSLVFQGGGVRGIAYLGALRYFLEENKWFLDFQRITKIAGASAGAVTSVLLALGYTPDEIKKLMEGSFTSNKIFDHMSERKEALAGLIKIYNEENENLIAKYWKILKHLFLLWPILRNQYGISQGIEIRDVFDEWISCKTGIKYCTFREMHDLLENGAHKNFKDIYIVAVNINSKTTEVFSWQHTPDMIISDALRCSMSIPVVFTPHGYYIKLPGVSSEKIIKRVQLISDGATSLYVDGGLNDNYPDWVFKNDRSLGFRLLKPDLINKYLYKNSHHHSTPKKDDMTFFSYCYKVISTYFGKQESDFSNRADPKSVVLIDTKGINTIDFEVLDNAGNEKREKLVESGQKGAQEYYVKYNTFFRSNSSAIQPKSTSLDDKKNNLSK